MAALAATHTCTYVYTLHEERKKEVLMKINTFHSYTNTDDMKEERTNLSTIRYVCIYK